MSSDKNSDQVKTNGSPSGHRFNGWQISTFILLAVLLILSAAWLLNSVLLPSEFKPVTLDASEQQVLDQKLQQLERFQSQADRRASRSRPFAQSDNNNLTPEPYSEEGASREIRLSEKELNALLAKNTDLATRLAIDLSDNLASAKLLVHLDEEFPLLGGNTVKLTAGAELAYSNGKPIVKLKGVSIWGVPIPNAWLGGIKNVDLIEEFGQEPGFWQAFADGVDAIEVKQGNLLIRLKE
jgi:hypothetical protein